MISARISSGLNFLFKSHAISKGGGRRVKKVRRTYISQPLAYRFIQAQSVQTYAITGTSISLLGVYLISRWNYANPSNRKKFLVYNRYSIIHANSVYAYYHSRGLPIREKIRTRVSREVFRLLMEPHIRNRVKGLTIEILDHEETRVAFSNLAYDVLNDKKLWAHSLISIGYFAGKGAWENPYGAGKSIAKAYIPYGGPILDGVTSVYKYSGDCFSAFSSLSSYYDKIFQQGDVINSIKYLVVDGVYNNLTDPKTYKNLVDVVAKVIKGDSFLDAAYDTYVKKPYKKVISYFYSK
ncbi:unnamed protein product [Moneuplotes crassus]|uniref:Uncharacterized protein n=1 Tax=Euplotes crassus TaxID=5936 RepID=A0AAD2D1W2_EUPCR|nr:unnamed protein product [Moneuplotes crassus]